ncbi:MAG: hypothetical protein N2C14_25180, partial [Planctomycetales bacterium]
MNLSDDDAIDFLGNLDGAKKSNATPVLACWIHTAWRTMVKGRKKVDYHVIYTLDANYFCASMRIPRISKKVETDDAAARLLARGGDEISTGEIKVI